MKYFPLIYIAEHGIYQFFDIKNEKSSFLKAEEVNLSDVNPDVFHASFDFPKTLKLAVISNNIKFSRISEGKDLDNESLFANKSLNSVKLTSSRKYLKKYIKKYYGDESYLLFENFNNEYGIYHAPHSIIHDYYSLKTRFAESLSGDFGYARIDYPEPWVDFVIPYDYLAILFLKSLGIIAAENRCKPKVGEADCGETHDGPVMFLEETENIYKLVIVVDGFSRFPVKSFKAEMIEENLGLITAEMNSLNIKIGKIVTNSGINSDLLNFFRDSEIINFNIKDLFEFFNNLDTQIPHFENLNVKIEKIKQKKNRLKNIYILSLIVFNVTLWASMYFFQKDNSLNVSKINGLNKEITFLNYKIEKNNARKVIYNEINTPDIVANLKKLISIFPLDARINHISIKKINNNFVVSGSGLISGGYIKFVKNYNEMIKNYLVRSNKIRISHNLEKFNKPIFKFYMKITNK